MHAAWALGRTLGLLPGPLRVPARSWLMDWLRPACLAAAGGGQTRSEARCSPNRRKMSMRSKGAEAAPCAQVAQGAVARQERSACGAPRGARVSPRGDTSYQIALFGAPSPSLG